MRQRKTNIVGFHLHVKSKTKSFHPLAKKQNKNQTHRQVRFVVTRHRRWEVRELDEGAEVQTFSYEINRY